MNKPKIQNVSRDFDVFTKWFYELFLNWLFQKWKDMLLRWDKERYDNISDVRLPSNKIWIPDILLYNL